MPLQEIALEALLDRLGQTDREYLATTLREHQSRSTALLRSWLDRANTMADILRDQAPDPDPSFPITQDMLNICYTRVRFNIGDFTVTLDARALLGEDLQLSHEESQEQLQKKFWDFKHISLDFL